MYFNRKSVPTFTKSQFRLRELMMGLCTPAHDMSAIIVKLEEIIVVNKELILSTSGTFDAAYFEFLNCFFTVIKFQASYLHAIESGNTASDSLKRANIFNRERLYELAAQLGPSKPSVELLNGTASEISNCLNLTSFFAKIDKLATINLPFVRGIETNPYLEFQHHHATVTAAAQVKEPDPILLSVRFLTDNELWANPQVLKPNTQYTINGLLKINRLPDKYNRLVIRHVSTTSDEFFILSLPEIELTDSLEYSISGQIVFKYSQTTFDPPVVIKLIAQLISSSEAPIYPHLIGYDELITKIIDESTFRYPTGFKKLNKKAFDICLQINKELPHIESEELDHFLILLSAVLNYAGYCIQYGIYKNIADLSEDAFRDRLIGYMSANPILTANIIKEGIIAGGRVEIRYENIITELKVEKIVSDRKKMVEQYKRQPSVYASAVSAELAILCILDLTPKILPSAIAADNVFLIPATFHGFENAPTTSKIAVIIIDGNLKNPSAY